MKNSELQQSIDQLRLDDEQARVLASIASPPTRFPVFMIGTALVVGGFYIFIGWGGFMTLLHAPPNTEMARASIPFVKLPLLAHFFGGCIWLLAATLRTVNYYADKRRYRAFRLLLSLAVRQSVN